MNETTGDQHGESGDTGNLGDAGLTGNAGRMENAGITGTSEAAGPAGNAGDSGKRRPDIVQVSILFSLTIVLFLFIGYRVQKSDFYSGILITEFGLIMLPAFIFLLLFKYDLKAVLRLKGTRPLNFLLTFVLMLFAIPAAGIFNLLNLFIVNSVFGKVIISSTPVAGNAQELLINILVIAGSAGLCEEFLFRGVIQRGFERFGAVKAILLAAFLFSLTHMDFQKIFGTFLLGALIGFIVYRTDSLFCGMFAHFTNNAVVVVISYLSTKFMAMFEKSQMKIPEQTDLNSLFSAFGSLSSQQLAIVLYFYGFIFLFIVSVFIILLYALIKVNPGKRSNAVEYVDVRRRREAGFSDTVPTGITSMESVSPPGMRKGKAKSLLWLLPGVLLIAGVYYLEVFKFTGAENGIYDAARQLLGI